MIDRLAVVREARTWIGTRYQHQASQKGLATDCGGLVYGVGAELGIFPRDSKLLPRASEFAGYPRQAHNGSLTRACEMLLEKIEFNQAQPGDLLLMKFETEPQHMAIVADYHHGGLSIIHADSMAHKGRELGWVVEVRLSDVWASRIVAAYKFPGIA